MIKLSFGEFDPDWEEVHEKLIAAEIRHPNRLVDGALFEAVTHQKLTSRVLLKDKVAILRGFQNWLAQTALAPKDLRVVLAAWYLAGDMRTLHPDYPLSGILADHFIGADEDAISKQRFSFWELVKRAGLEKFSVDMRAEWVRMQNNGDSLVSMIYGTWEGIS